MFKNLKLLNIYIKILKQNKKLLKDNHEINFDWIYRMYKVYTIPPDELENIKQFGVKYFDELLKKEISKIDKTFINIGLGEFVALMDVVELNSTQFGLAFRFKYFNTAKAFSTLLWLLFTVFFGLIGFAVGCYLGLTIGLISTLIIFLITRIFI